MTRVTLRQVISAVKRLRGGQQGVRLNEVVEYISESLHQRAVWKALNVAVRNGTIVKRGNRFRLKKAPGGRREYLGKSSKKESKRKSTLFCTRESRNKKRTPQTNNRSNGRSQSEKTSDCTREREKRSDWSTQRSLSSKSTSRTGNTNRTSRSLVRRRPRGHRNPSPSSSDSECFSPVNSRLVSTRDSVELLKERMSHKSSGNRVSYEFSDHDVSPCSATSMFPSFRW